MVKCSMCKHEMLFSQSCTVPYVKIGKKWYKRNTSYFDSSDLSPEEIKKELKELGDELFHCHDCGIENKEGNVHHFGCDVEKCPKCKDQFAFCKCKKEIFANKEGMEKEKRKLEKKDDK